MADDCKSSGHLSVSSSSQATGVPPFELFLRVAFVVALCDDVAGDWILFHRLRFVVKILIAVDDDTVAPGSFVSLCLVFDSHAAAIARDGTDACLRCNILRIAPVASCDHIADDRDCAVTFQG